MHRGRSIVGGGRNIISSIVAHKGCRKVHLGLSTLHSGCIIQDASAQIVDTRLTLILGHGYNLVVSIFA